MTQRGRIGVTLEAFLAARLGEDEANAKDALALWPETHWTIDPGSLVLIHFHGRHDPARVIREVAAKRAILAEHAPCAVGVALIWCSLCHREIFDAREDEDRFESVDWPCPTVRGLAAVYSDHPDYDASQWASPEGGLNRT